MKKSAFLLIAAALLLAASSQGSAAEPEYRVCAFVWPSCHDDSLAHEYLWKEGIGEWEVIRQGNPRFEGHYQPKQPLWGYEMDDDPAVVEKWIDTALSHGVNTFVYDWYWFKDYPYLEGALDNGFLKAPSCGRMGFYLMWANHDVKYNYWNWHLHGDNEDLLFTGEVTPEQYETIVHRVIDKYFGLDNYVKIDDCPVFMIFSLENFLETFGGDVDRAAEAIRYFREECVKAGFKGLHLQSNLRTNGIDRDWYLKDFDGLRRKLGIDSFVNYNMGGKDIDYLTYGEKGTEYWYRWSEYLDVPFFPTVSIGWDDTPRFPGKGKEDVVLYNRTPEAFQRFLEGAKTFADTRENQPKFVYINAWNEWIEDAYLLPDVRYGFGYLDAVRNVFSHSYILTPKAPDTPRINGPKIYGNYPGTPFLYKIPATGVRPMTFSAESLPRGLKLDPETGIITGQVKKRGTWDVTLKAENALGADSRRFRIVIGDKLCLTPPMGWNSWNCWRISVSQEKVLSSANALVERGLDQYGWSYINIDDGWQYERGGRHFGIQPNSKFPDMKALADHIHSLGLKFGIYSSPWAMCPGGTIGSSACNPEGKYWWIEEGHADEYNTHVRKPGEPDEWEAIRYHGKYLFMKNDARQWADWGVDFLKYDWHPNDYFSIREMHDALAGTGRSIVYSLSNRAPIGLGDVYVNMTNAWRTSSDIKDLWPDVYRIGFTMMDRWAAYTGPGHWPDADMLEIGDVADRANPGHTRSCRLTPDEQYTHVTLWAILCSPLLIGCDLANMDDFTFSLLTNNEVIDVNQDPLGFPAARVLDEDGAVVYHKPLEDGSLVVALFNVSDSPKKMGFRLGELGYMMVESQTVRDLWRQQDITVLNPGERFGGDSFETEVAPHGCRLLKLSPGLNYNQGIWWPEKK